MKVISIIGTKKTGKTTTVCEIIKELIKRGYSVGSIKSIHYENFALDSEGTNTHKHKSAGASPVTALGLNETDIMFNCKMDISKLLRFYDNDFVIIEGEREINAPKIVAAKDENSLIDADNIIAISGVISCSSYTHPSLPVINALSNASELVDLIEGQKDFLLN